MNLARFSLANFRGLLLTVVFISLLGALATTQMPAALLPDFPYPRLAVVVHAGDLAIQDVVIRVTRQLESAAAAVPGAKRVVSHTSRGAVELSVDFDWGTDMFQAYSRFNAMVTASRSQMPPGVEVQVEWVTPSQFPIAGIDLTSERVSLRDLRDEAQLTLAPTLSRLKGVYRAVVSGGHVREFQVLVNSQALLEQNLSMEQVQLALNKSNLIRSVGRYDQQAQSYLVLVDATVLRAAAILDNVIDVRGARVLRIRDVATVREGDEEEQHTVVAGYRGADGRPMMREAVQIEILKQPGASTAEVSREVRAALADLKEGLSPGTLVNTWYDEAELLHESQASLKDSILTGGVLAMLVLLLVLRSWRGMLVVLLSLPVTVLLAFGCLKLLGESLNLMTLGGLAVGLGLIIDDVVVTLENVHRHLELGKAPLQAAIDGAAEIQKPMIGSTLSAVAVFLPLAFLGDIVGALFAPLSVTLVILLAGSMLLAVTFVPILCALLLKPVRRQATQDTTTPNTLQRGYEGLIRGALAAPWMIIAGAALFAICGAAAQRGLSSGLMPEMDEGAFVLDYRAPAGTPLNETDRACRVMEQELMAMPEVAGFCRRTGLEMGFFATSPDTGDTMVRLNPRSQRRRTMTELMEAAVARCQERLPSYRFEAFPPLADRVQDIAGEPSPVEVKIFGEEPAQLVRIAEQVETVLKSVGGVTEGAHEVTPGGPELTVRVDPEKAGLLGLSPEDVANTLELSMFGRVESYASRGDRLIGLRAYFPKEERRTEEQVRRLPLLSRGGRIVRLEDVAEVKSVPGILDVVRENQRPMLPVTATITGRDLGSTNEEVMRRVRAEVKLPPGYTIQFGGVYFTQQEAFRNLFWVFLLGAMLVYLVTLFQYNGFAEPTVLVATGACAVVSVALALFATRTPLNVASLTGAIMIFGMVMTNGIVLMDTIRHHRRNGLELEEAIVAAGHQRLRPVLLTAAIALLTLIPLALGIGSGAEMQKPLAIAVIGGLLTSPLFTLVFAPTLLYVMQRRQSRKRGLEIVAAVAIAASLGLPRLAAAQTPAATPDDPAELYRKAETTYPSLLAARKAREAAEFRAVVAGAMPPLLLDVGHGFGTNAAGDDEDLLLTGRIELGGKRTLRQNVALREVEAARADEAQARIELAFRLRTAVADLQAAQSEEHLAREGVRLAQEFLRLARVRFEAGDVALADVVRAELEAGNAEAALTAAMATTAARRAPVNALIGSAPDAPVTVSRLSADSPTLPDLAKLREQALHRPDVVAATATLAARQAAIESARTGRRPDLTLSAAHASLGQSRGNVLRLGVEFPIWDHGVTRAKTGEARAAAEEQAASVQVARLQALQDVESAYRLLVGAVEQARQLGGPQLARAERLRGLAELGYREGHSSYLELIDAQRAYLSTAQQYQRALAALATAEAALTRAVGDTSVRR